MSKTIEVWLDDEAEAALSRITASGLSEGEAIRKAVIGAATHTNTRPLVSDHDALEQAMDKSHEIIAEVLETQRPPR